MKHQTQHLTCTLFFFILLQTRHNNLFFCRFQIWYAKIIYQRLKVLERKRLLPSIKNCNHRNKSS